jgi:hypothetical protein
MDKILQKFFIMGAFADISGIENLARNSVPYFTKRVQQLFNVKKRNFEITDFREASLTTKYFILFYEFHIDKEYFSPVWPKSEEFLIEITFEFTKTYPTAIIDLTNPASGEIKQKHLIKQ